MDNNLDKDAMLRLTALDRAISSGVGTSYDSEGRHETRADKIIEAAKKFEDYLKGEKNV